MIRDKARVKLDLTNYDSKKEFEHATGVKKDYFSLKAGVDKLDINQLVDVPTSLNNAFKK